MIAPQELGHIGVVMGGCSSERDISFKSGRAIVQALGEQGCRVSPLELDACDAETVLALIRDARVDVVFIALHGVFGEDGEIQQILESAGIPYTGSDSRTSRVTINKVLTQQALQKNGILVPRYCVLQEGDRDGIAQIQKIISGAHVVVKPACEGSSIGITIVQKMEELAAALDLAFSFGRYVLVEQHIAGRELTAGILDGKALPLVEIRAKNAFFDFNAKYQKGMTEYIVPAPVPDETAQQIQEVAVTAFRALGCRDLSRIDFILDAKNQPYLLEINTIPGFTETSLLPKAARQAGIGFGELCFRIAGLAAVRRTAGMKS